MKYLSNIITEVLREWADSDEPVTQSPLSKMPGCPYNGKIQQATTLMSNESRAAFQKWKRFVEIAQEKLGPSNTWKPNIINYACKLGNAVEQATGAPSPANSNQPANSNAGGYTPNIPFSGPF